MNAMVPVVRAEEERRYLALVSHSLSAKAVTAYDRVLQQELAGPSTPGLPNTKGRIRVTPKQLKKVLGQ